MRLVIGFDKRCIEDFDEIFGTVTKLLHKCRFRSTMFDKGMDNQAIFYYRGC